MKTIYDKIAEIKFVLNLFLRGKPCSIAYLLGLIIFPLILDSQLNNPDKFVQISVIVFGSIILTRYINLHKLISCYADGLITISTNFFKSLMSGLYSINIIYSLYWCIIIYCYTSNIFFAISCFSLSMGLGPIINFLYTIYDPGNYSIYSPILQGQNIRYNYSSIKANLIFFVSFFVLIIVCSLFYKLFLPEIATSIIVIQGLIFLFTKKIWLNKLNNIYLKNRYENLAKCRGEKFNK